jgi:hypothetical protein
MFPMALDTTAYNLPAIVKRTLFGILRCRSADGGARRDRLERRIDRGRRRRRGDAGKSRRLAYGTTPYEIGRPIDSGIYGGTSQGRERGKALRT